MLLDIRDTDTILISPCTGKYRDRLLSTHRLCVDHGFNRIMTWRSVEDEYGYNSLTRTTVEILRFRKEFFPNIPFIILEDDVEWCGGKQYHINIPDDARAMYIGYAQWIYPFRSLKPDEDFQDWSKTMIIPIEHNPSFYSYDAGHECLRIRGMTSTHSILYTGVPDYLERCIVNLERAVGVRMNHDLVFACLQREFPVYSVLHPMFFQAANKGGCEKETLFRYDKQSQRVIPFQRKDLSGG